MSRVCVVCEGQTEEEFVRDVLAPGFFGLGLYLEPQMVETSPGHRGGALNYDRVKPHLRNTLCQKSAPVFTQRMRINNHVHFASWYVFLW